MPRHSNPHGLLRGSFAGLAIVNLFGCLTQAGCSSTANHRPPARPNVLLICIDDLRPELGCYGKPYVVSPHIDRLARSGRQFNRHYVQAPTCGASRYALLTGRYGPPDNDALFRRAERFDQTPEAVPPSMPAWFRQSGYTTVSVGKVSHHPGGRGGDDWNDEGRPELPGAWDRHLMPTGPWRHPRGAMHGLANGEIRHDAGAMDVFQSVEGGHELYPDGLIADAAMSELSRLAGKPDRPFFLAVGLIRPHLPFGAPSKYMQPYASLELPPIPHPGQPIGRTTWHPSREFMKYHRWGRDPNHDPEFADQVRKHYLACVTYADAQVGRILETLETTGAADRTIIVLWGDHGWHLGEHAVWGKHTLFEESLHAPLIIRYSHAPNPGQATDALVETVDLFPTLCELAGLPLPEFTNGRSLRDILDEPNAAGKPAVSYFRDMWTIRTRKHRLIVHGDGYMELYEHASEDAESRNITATNPELAEHLLNQLNARIASP